jgi:hypothetical protein
MTPDVNNALREAANRIAAAREADEAAHPHDLAGINRRAGMREAERIVRLAGGPREAEAAEERAFFRPGTTYSHGSGPYRAPELATVFRCVAVADHPQCHGELRAFGFVRDGSPDAPWASTVMTEREWAQGWTGEGGGW